MQRNDVLSHTALVTGGCAAISGVVKDVIFYSIDSYKVVKQAGQQVKLSNLFRGTLPIAMLGSGFSFGTFFIFYHPLRNTLVGYTNKESASVLLASVISSIPSSIVGVPADVLKKQLILGNVSQPCSAVTPNSNSTRNLRSIGASILRTQGIRGLFLGWRVNVMRDMPYAAMKMSLYEGLARLYLSWKHAKTAATQKSVPKVENGSVDKLLGVEAAVMGLASGVITAAITCPIDCVNTRIKSGELVQYSMTRAHMEIVHRDGVSALFRGVVPRCTILGLGSTVFWYVQASLLRAVQE